MSQAEFDVWRDDYERVVDRSIEFSGLGHDFFMAAKADLLAEVAAERLGGGQNVRLLDVGCGVGRLHAHLKGRFGEVHGCDVSQESIARAALENPTVSYCANERPRLPYPDDAFDLVTTSCVLHHVPPADWLTFARELRRVTRPGGVAVVIEHNPWNPLTRLAVSRCPFDADAVLLSGPRAKRLMLAAGFGSASNRFFLTFPSSRPTVRRLERLLSRAPLGAQYATVAAA